MNIPLLYINLAKRADRKEHVEKQIEELRQHGLEAESERFNAIYHLRGEIGCSLSHAACIEHAKSKGWPKVFICEDDITFLDAKATMSSLSAFLASSTSWDVIMIGANCYNYEAHDENAVRVTNAQTTTGYIVASHYYDTLLENFNKGINLLLTNPVQCPNHFAIDMYWKQLQRKDLWFLIIPLHVIQLPSHSDILHCHQDYGQTMLLLKKS